MIYYDLHGRGKSDRPTDLAEITFDGDVADVAELISSLKTGPVHLYGFSYGGCQFHLTTAFAPSNSVCAAEVCKWLIAGV